MDTPRPKPRAPLPHVPRPAGSAAFTLVELLAVVAIVGFLIAMSIKPLQNITVNGSIDRTIRTVAGAIEQARQHAVANGTYTYVGIQSQKEGPDWELLVVALASLDGTDAMAENSTLTLPADEDIVQMLIRPTKFLQFELLPDESDFSVTVERPDASEGLPERYQIDIQQQSFEHVFSFTPTGELRTDDRISLPTRMEFAIIPVIRGRSNPVIFQVAGLTGITRVYRPGLN